MAHKLPQDESMAANTALPAVPAAPAVAVTVEGNDSTLTADRTLPPPGRAVEEPAAPLPVRRRDRYEILGEHGRGGLGRVSRARDRELGRNVAIKELIQRGDLREIRFLREAMITARLEHPGIVPIHEAGRWDDGTPFYAMKLVSGRSLKELLATCETLDQRLGLLHHVNAVADAIAYAHGQRVIHRDLKPANVIVGEFGETVVIDWGLAKDLSAAEDAAASGGPNRTRASDELSAAGSIVGTPAYMAPEQARGEPVDERVDVYAIGVMLWELCTRTRVPPGGRHRERVLRRAGIDRDLAAIIAKALAPRPGGRYRDAGALAADLRAFHAGARIAARHYSLLAILAHWTRRHRTLAISVAVATLIAIGGVAGFVHNIAVERDRADASSRDARAQQRDAEQARNQIILEHAELQLHGDPSAAMASLAGYRGGDPARLQRLRAEAAGRGVATAMLRPHTEAVRFLAADPSGAIVSLSQDRSIRLTRGTQSTVLAGDVLMPIKFRYMPEARTLAYATAPGGVAVLSLASHAITRIPTGPVRAMDLLADGSRLATLAPDDTLTVWSLAPRVELIHRERIAGARDFEFATATRLVVQLRGALRTLWLEPGHPDALASIASRDFEVDPDRVFISDDQGNIALLSSQLALRSRISVCHRSVTNVNLVPHTELAAFVCEEGIAGVARYDAATARLTVVDTFPTVERPYRIYTDPMGTRILVKDDSHIVYLYDIATRMVTRYEAAAQVATADLPTSEFDHLLVGDAHGNVRIWDPPPRDARKLLQAPSAVFDAVFDPRGASLVTAGADGAIRRIDLANGAVTELAAHPEMTGVSLSPDGRSILSHGRDGTARVSRVADGAVTRVLADHASAVEAAAYIDDGRRVVSIGGDGRLLEWSPTGSDVSVRLTRALPLTALAVVGHGDHLVVQDAVGSIWDVRPGGAPGEVRRADEASVTALQASPDGRLVAIGTAAGAITVHDTARWAIVATAQVGAGVRRLRFDPHDRDLIVIAEDRTVHALALDRTRTLPWHDLAMPALDAAYAPDGNTLAFVCSDGGSWFYDLHRDRWAFTLDHPSDALSGAFSPDGALFASSDLRGAVTVRDVAATLRGGPGARAD